MSEARALRLQRAMASLILDEAVIGADLGPVAHRQGVNGADQRSFCGQTAALMTYRELARSNLVDAVETMFPVLMALLEGAGAWGECIEAFLRARVIRSTQYRDIAPAFLGWLASTGWGQDRWPFILELAHVEILEVLVSRFPDSDSPERIHDEPGPEDRVILDAATQIVTYHYAVHRATCQEPIPEERPTHLMAFRDREGMARLMELTPATSALLIQAQSMPLSDTARAMGLSELTATMDLLRNLHRDGAIAGFQTPV